MFTKLLICIILFLMLSLRIESASVAPTVSISFSTTPASLSLSNSVSTVSISKSNSVSTISISFSVSISFSPFSTPFNPAPINFIYTTPYDSSYGACYYDPNKLDVCLAWADQVSWSNELGYILSTYINPSSCSAGLASKQSPVSIDRFNYTNSLFVTGLTASTQYCFTLQGVKIQNFEEVISLPTYLSYTTPAIGPCIDITYGITQEVIVIVQSTTGSGKYNIYFKWVNGQTDYQQIEVKISCQVHVGNNNYRVFTYKKFLNSFTTSITDTIFIVGNIEVIVETITIRYFHVTYLDNCVVHRDQNYYKK